MHIREYLAEDLIDEDVSDEDLQRDVNNIKTITLDAILAVLDADKGAVRAPVFNARNTT